MRVEEVHIIDHLGYREGRVCGVLKETKRGKKIGWGGVLLDEFDKKNKERNYVQKGCGAFSSAFGDLEICDLSLFWG